MTNSTTCTIFFNNSWDCIMSIKLNSLITRIRACEITSTALQTFFLIYYWCFELMLTHLFYQGYMIKFGTHYLSNSWSTNHWLLFFNLVVQFLIVKGWILPSPTLSVFFFILEHIEISLQTGLKIIEYSSSI